MIPAMSGDTTCGISGGCLCGAVRYRIFGKADGTCHCHCKSCRKSTGSAMVTWTTVAKKHFELISGTLVAYPSSDKGNRLFCADCGSHIAFENTEYPDYLDITVGTLDEPGKIPPERHIWTSLKIKWVEVDNHLPKIRTL